MAGKSREIDSDLGMRGNPPRIKILATIILIAVVAFISFRGSFFLQEFGYSVHLPHIQVLLYYDEDSDENNRYQALVQQNNRLKHEIDALILNNIALKRHLSTVHQENAQRPPDLTWLKTNYQGLNQQFSTNHSSSVTAPYVSISRRTIHLAFHKLDQTLVNWTVPFDSLEQAIKKADMTRSGLFGLGMPTIALKATDRAELIVADFRAFMDTDTFKDVMTTLYEQSPDDETFIREVWNLVGQMVGYEHETDEVPRFPLETLVGGAGDCEDTAILLASLIKSAPVDWDLDFVYLNSLSPLDTQGVSDHVIVYIDTGTARYYIETTSVTVMEPYPDGVAGWHLAIN